MQRQTVSGRSPCSLRYLLPYHVAAAALCKQVPDPAAQVSGDAHLPQLQWSPRHCSLGHLQLDPNIESGLPPMQASSKPNPRRTRETSKPCTWRRCVEKQNMGFQSVISSCGRTTRRRSTSSPTLPCGQPTISTFPPMGQSRCQRSRSVGPSQGAPSSTRSRRKTLRGLHAGDSFRSEMVTRTPFMSGLPS